MDEICIRYSWLPNRFRYFLIGYGMTLDKSVGWLTILGKTWAGKGFNLW